MPTTTSTITEEIRDRLDQRLDELRPLVEEYTMLTDLRENVVKEYVSPRRKNGAARNGSAPKATPKGKPEGRKRHRHGAPLRQEILTMLKKKDGLTIKEISRRKNAAVGYTYAVVKSLTEEGAVERRDGKVFLAA